MYEIAIRMLFGDKAKCIAMIAGISFASLIMTQQPSILVGLLSRTYSFILDVSAPDIWVMDKGVQFVEENKPIRSTDLHRVRGVEGVQWAVPMYKTLMRAKLPDGSSVSVDVTGVDDATLTGAPVNLIGCTIDDIRRPSTVFVDKNAAEGRLRVRELNGGTRALQIGDYLEMNDRKALVIGFLEAKRNFVLQPQVYTLYSRAKEYAPKQRRDITYVLVKARKGINQKDLAKSIEEKTNLKAMTSEDFCDQNLNYWMKNTGIPINFGTSVLLGFIVGAAVAGQTFLGFIRENMKHYAALQAMGLNSKILQRMVMLQALVVGFAGYGIGAGLTALFGLKFTNSVLAFRLDPSILLYAGLGVGIIILVAAYLGVKQLKASDPSLVFRS